MFESLLEFLLKSLTLLLTLGLLGFIAMLFISRLHNQKTELEIESLGDKYENWKWAIQSMGLDKKGFKKLSKEAARAEKSNSAAKHKRLYVVEFDGDLHASQVDQLRNEITAVLQSADPKCDQVLCKVTSPGGVVQDYGLAAAQLKRVTEAKLPLTVAIDSIAASGGYLVACVANHITASPFAVVGSIGVIAQVPNLHRLLKRFDVDYKEYTAGEFKRTISLFGEIHPKGEAKFIEQLEGTHQFFKSFVKEHRPSIQIDQLATGEFWYGAKAQELGLVDSLETSDAFILKKIQEGYQALLITYSKKRSWQEKLSGSLQSTIEKALLRLVTQLKKSAP